jgi:hypothetical protein
MGKSDAEQGCPPPEEFLTDQLEQRVRKIADAMEDERLYPGVTRVSVRAVLVVLGELGHLDGVYDQWVRAEDSLAELTAELERDRGRDIGFTGTALSIADALDVEAQRALAAAGSVHPRFAEGHQAGAKAFRERLERRAAEIRRGSDNRVHPTMPSVAPSSGGSQEEQEEEQEDRPSVPSNRPSGDAWLDRVAKRAERAAWDAWLDELAWRVAAMLERPTPYSDVDFGRSVLSIARAVGAARCSPWDHYSPVGATHRALQLRLVQRWSSVGFTAAEIHWRNALAKELREQAAYTAGGSGRVGGDFVSGFNLACNRISAALTRRAQEIAIPDHLVETDVMDMMHRASS